MVGSKIESAIRPGANRPFSTRLMPLPPSHNAAAHVTVDGMYYASFVDEYSAQDAVDMWMLYRAPIASRRIRIHRGPHGADGDLL